MVPHHNGDKFLGKVVRVNLRLMENATYCALMYRQEYYNEMTQSIQSTGWADACVFVLDSASVNPAARGFRALPVIRMATCLSVHSL